MFTKAWVCQFYKNVIDPVTGEKKRVPRSPNWKVQWYDPITGKRRTESCGPRKRDAERRAREIEALIVSGQYTAKQVTTWDEFRKRFEEEVMALHSEGHREQMVVSLNKFEKLCKPDIMDRITTAMIDSFKAKRFAEKYLGEPVSPNTVNRDLGNLRIALRRARRWKLITEVPEFEMIRVPEERPNYVPVETFKTLYKACPDDAWRGMISLAYLAGLRREEVLTLRWSDLDLKGEPATVTVRATIAKARRADTIPIVPELAELLKRFKVPALRLHGDQGKRPRQAGSDGLVVPWADSKSAWYRDWHAILDKIGLERQDHFTFHDLRKSYGTNLAKHVEASVLQRLMRHKSISTTVKHYVDGAQHMASSIADLPTILPKTKKANGA